jgi:hypothetical protein|tara:strand:- start:2431 stop:3297 length:867 start_codon:yes stop_codon:yes gene_type:complete
MKKTAFAAFTILLIFIPQVSANFSYSPIKYTPKQMSQAGLYLGGQIWQSSANGAFGEEISSIDVNSKKEQQTSYFMAIVHPFPFLPNARISISSLDTIDKTTLTQEFNFGGEKFSTGDDIYTNFNVSYVDYTLYYQLLDNRKFSFDLGVTARDLNGDVTATGATIIIDNEDDCPETPRSNICPSPAGTYTPTGKIKTDDIVPMLYIAANLSLPLTNLNFFAQGDFSLIDDHTLFDYQIGLSYELAHTRMVDFNLTLGYKVVKMELEGLNNLYTDLKFKGVFVGLIAHF